MCLACFLPGCLVLFSLFFWKVLTSDFCFNFCQVESDLRFSNESYRKLPVVESNNISGMAKAATRIAFLGVSALDLKVEVDLESDP